jgi:hypothetical protein
MRWVLACLMLVWRGGGVMGCSVEVVVGFAERTGESTERMVVQPDGTLWSRMVLATRVTVRAVVVYVGAGTR